MSPLHAENHKAAHLVTIVLAVKWLILPAAELPNCFLHFSIAHSQTPDLIIDVRQNQVCEKGWHMSKNVVEVRALAQFRRTVEQWHRLELCVTITAREIISSQQRVVRLVSGITKIFFIGEHFTFLS